MIHDGTHNVGPGKRRMCECCGERPARIGFMCLVCFGGEAAPPVIEPPRPDPEPVVAVRVERVRARPSGPRPRPPRGRYAGDAIRERTAYRRKRLGLPADTTAEDVDAAWQLYRTERHAAHWPASAVTPDAEDS